jgi:mannose-6-phosphate isomerase
MIQSLEPRFVERVWGRRSLAPLFGEFDRNIGEVWFSASPNDPLLVKFIFTSERLSVQVHPDDAYALQHEGSCGKTEMWHILEAGPGASIALGFRDEVSRDQLRQAIFDGTVADLLNWVPVRAGETFYAPARTVHAIGAGLALCEVQQQSDITYRLYDYGRPRELHLERGLEVASTVPFDGRRELPLECPFFTTDLLQARHSFITDVACEYLLIVLEGKGQIGGQLFKPGEVWQVTAGHGPLEIVPDAPARLLRTRRDSASRNPSLLQIPGEFHTAGK